MKKTIYLKFLIILIASSASSSYLHAENYPSGIPDASLEEQDGTQISGYAKNNNQVTASPSAPQTQFQYQDTQNQYAAMQAANSALAQRAAMGLPQMEPQPNLQEPTAFQAQPNMGMPQPPQLNIQTPTALEAQPHMEAPQPPQFIQNTSSTEAITTQNADNLQAPSTNIKQPNQGKKPSKQKCGVVCGQYSNYTYATLISSIVQSASVTGNEMMQKVTTFTRGQIQNKAQCTAEALTPHLSGKNALYSKERFFPGMPRPQLFYRVCKKQCLSGKDGIIFKNSNPVIIEFMRQYDFTHGKKEDKALALIAASGNGGFEDDASQPTEPEKKK